MLEIQTAVRRNPRHPQFDVMEIAVTAFVDQVGGTRASSYHEWLPEQQKGEAKRLKAVREYREEASADQRRRADEARPEPKKKGAGKDKNKKKDEEP